MLSGIQTLEPFDWEGEPHTSEHTSHSTREAESGLDSIRHFTSGDAATDAATISTTEQNILRSLLTDAKVDVSLEGGSKREYNEADVMLLEDELRDESIKGLSDRAIAELNVQGKTSLFGSILRMFDVPESEQEEMEESAQSKEAEAKSADDPLKECDDLVLSSAEIVRSVHLSARPGDIPPAMDSKEFTLAVLAFLSSNVPFLSEDESSYRPLDDQSSQEGWNQLRDTLPVLPLIKSVDPNDSINIRSFKRVRPLVSLEPGAKIRKDPERMDSDEHFRRKVLNLERFYVSELPYTSSVDLHPVPPPVSCGTGSTSGSSSPSQAQLKHMPHSLARYVARRRLVPHIKPVNFGKEELALMISGHFYQPPQNPGNKSSKSKGTSAAQKEKAGAKKAKGSSAKHPKPQAKLANAEIDAKQSVSTNDDYSDLADIDVED